MTTRFDYDNKEQHERLIIDTPNIKVKSACCKCGPSCKHATNTGEGFKMLFRHEIAALLVAKNLPVPDHFGSKTPHFVPRHAPQPRQVNQNKRNVLIPPFVPVQSAEAIAKLPHVRQARAESDAAAAAAHTARTTSQHTAEIIARRAQAHAAAKKV